VVLQRVALVSQAHPPPPVLAALPSPGQAVMEPVPLARPVPEPVVRLARAARAARLVRVAQVAQVAQVARRP